MLRFYGVPADMAHAKDTINAKTLMAPFDAITPPRVPLADRFIRRVPAVPLPTIPHTRWAGQETAAAFAYVLCMAPPCSIRKRNRFR